VIAIRACPVEPRRARQTALDTYAR